jgi:hypothetical protein
MPVDSLALYLAVPEEAAQLFLAHPELEIDILEPADRLDMH